MILDTLEASPLGLFNDNNVTKNTLKRISLKHFDEIAGRKWKKNDSFVEVSLFEEIYVS